MLRCLYALGLSMIFCGSLAAQTPEHISYRCENSDLSEVLDAWEARFGLAFAYESSLLAGKSVSLELSEEPIESALSHLFSGQQISYELLNRRYVILQEISSETAAKKTYCGRVLDDLEHIPLPGATVLLAGMNQGTQTDADGYFSLHGHWPENQELVISFLGFSEFQAPLSSFLSADCRQVKLKAGTISMPTAIIREFTVDMLESAREENRFRFNPERIPTLPGWGEPDILRSLQLLPGISTADGSASNLNIRGGTSDQNLLLWDGIPIYQSGHFFGQYSSINPYLVQSVDVYRGGYQAAYGGRVAGVIDITGKPQELEEAQYGVGMNLINAHAFAELPIPELRSSLLLGGRRSYTDLIRSPTYQNLFDIVFQKGRLSDNRDVSEELQATTIDPELFYQDFNFKWATEIDDNNRFSFSWYGAKDRFNYEFIAGSLRSRDAQSQSNNGYSFRYDRVWRDESRAWLRFTRSHLINDYFFTYTYDRVNIPSVWEVKLDNELVETNIDFNQSWNLGSGHQLSLGAQWQKLEAGFRFREKSFETEQELEQRGANGRKLAVYSDYSWRPDSSFHLEIGLRREGFLARDLERHRVLEQGNWQPRIQMSWQPFALPLTIRGSTGIYWQFVYQTPVGFTDLGSNDQIWVLADAYFPALRSRELSLGIQYRPANWLFELDVYRRKTYNLSARDFELVIDTNDPFKLRGSGLARGIDFLTRYRERRYSSWLAYSLGKVDYLYQDNNGLVSAYSPDHDQLHRLNLTQMISWPKWEFSLSWHWASGQPYTLPVGASVSINAAGDNEYQLRYARLNDERLGGVHRLDLTANYKWIGDNWQGKLGLSLYNLYNRRNIFDRDFFILPPSLEENRPEAELVALERQMLPLTVNLFLQLEFQ